MWEAFVETNSNQDLLFLNDLPLPDIPDNIPLPEDLREINFLIIIYYPGMPGN